MKYNYSYYSTPISRSEFLQFVPKNWEYEVDEFRCYSHGGYTATLKD